MKRITDKCRQKIRKHRRGTSRFVALFLALAMVVSLGVDLSTTNLVYATEKTTENTEQTYTCGKEAHTHSIEDGCYELICDQDETDGHVHTLDCYEGVDPTCGIDESDPAEAHHHDLDCYGNKVLTCTNEDEDHEHAVECYDLGDPTCGLDETEGTEGHTHSLDCYKDAAPVCGEDETDGHEHSIANGCYELTCDKEEHEHTEDCLTSGEPVDDDSDDQNDENQDAKQSENNEDEQNPDESNGDSNENPNEGSDEHTHTLDCYDNKVLTCENTDEDHEHTLDCYDLGDPTCKYAEDNKNDGGDEDEDPVEHTANADYDQDWKDAAQNAIDLDKSNDETKAQTLADIVSSQAGYTAQILDADAEDEDAEPLYSLYSNWYTNGENSTKDWNTTFAFWSLSKAGFDTEKELDVTSTALPIRSDISAWIKALVAKQDATLDAEDAYYASLAGDDEDADSTDDAASVESGTDDDKTTHVHALTLYMNTKEDGLSLTAGDIIFLDLDQNGKADHVGITASVDSDEDTGVTNDVAVVIADLDQDTLADLDETNDALDEDNAEVNVAAAIALPGDNYDGDRDDEDAVQSYLESYIIGTIPMLLYEQQLNAINNGDVDPDEPDDGLDDDKPLDIDTIHGITYTTGSKAAQPPIMLAAGDEADAADGVDMSDYVTSATFKKKNGVIWEVSTSFKTSDQVQGSINFDQVPVSTIKDSNNKIYIDLPEGIDCSKFENKSYPAYDSKYSDTEPSGTYTYEKQEDGSYRLVLTLTENYLNSEKIGDTIGGNLAFEFYWDVEHYPTQDKYKIEIGKWDGQIEIIPDKKEEEDDKNAKYGINKSTAEDAFSYSDDGKTLYINYEITLTVKEAMAAPINLKDVLEGEGFTYDQDHGITVTGGDVKANFQYSQGTGAQTGIQLWPNDGSTVPAGTYILAYRVKSTVDASDPEALKNLATSVHNTIKVPDSDDGITSQIWTNITKGTINKQGELASGSGATYIDYTVYLNAGDIVANIKTPAQFTDTLPDALELVGDVTVKQYNYKGVLQNTTTVTVADGKNISYTTPTGQYYYVITYRTKLKNSDIPLGGLTVKNDGKSTGGIDGSSSSEVVIPNHKLHKVSNGEPSLDTSTNTDTVYWKSTIDVEGSLKDYTYEDWAGLGYTDTKWYFKYVSMSDEQRAAIVVKDADGNVVDGSKYTVTTSDHVSSLKDIDGNIINDGLFKMTFSEDVTGPVTLEYECTADMTNFNLNSAHRFTNYASLTDKDGNVDEDTATKDITYHHGDPKKITKYGAEGNYDEGESGSITIEPGQKWIPWTIAVNGGQSLYSDLKITDTISDDLTYVDGSLWITINGQLVKLGEQGKWKDGVKWSIDGKTITVEIKKSAYSSSAIGNKYSNLIFIGYRTDLPDSFFTDDTITDEFSNHASLEIDKEIVDTDYTQKVTRKVVGKNGSFDATTGTLTYEIAINPDGSRLNKGNDLKVEDTLTTLYDSVKEFMQYVSLDSLELFTAVKDTDASTGKVTVKAGTLIRKLNQVNSTDSITVGEDYYYDDTTKTFITWLPDETGYVIVAKYLVTQEVNADVAMKNTVKLTGSDTWSGEDSSTKIYHETSGTTYTKKDTVTVTKRDASSYNTKLSGAIFRLDYWDGSAWQTFTGDTTHSDGTITTGTNGTGTFQDIQYKTLYRLVETQEPDGYLINETPSYFIVVRKSDEGNASTYLPDSIAGESTYSRDAVGINVVKDNITYDDGTVITEVFANVMIDRYDEKDTTRTEPGQLRVIKQWVNSAGNTITDPTKLATMPEVTITLTKHAAPKYTVTFQGTQSSERKVEITKGQSVKFPWQYYEAKQFTMPEGTTASLTWQTEYYENSNQGVVTISNITSDLVITVNEVDVGPLQTWFAPKANGTPTTDVEHTPIADSSGNTEFKLNAANGYTYLFSNLEKGDGITYTLTETTVDGYTTTYKVDAGDITSDAPTFSLNTDNKTGDTATITNTAKKTSLKVRKVWNDAGVDHTTDSVTIYLLRGIKEIGKDEISYSRVQGGDGTDMSVTLSANLIDNQNWKAIFTDLATEDDDGNKYYYTVEEEPVPENYSVSIEYTTDSSDESDPNYPSQPLATVTNTKLYSMPETGGSGTLMFYTFGALALMVSLLGGYSMRRRDERRER